MTSRTIPTKRTIASIPTIPPIVPRRRSSPPTRRGWWTPTPDNGNACCLPARNAPGCGASATSSERPRAGPYPHAVDEARLRHRLGRVRGQGQRLHDLPAALLQPGPRPAGGVGRLRDHDGPRAGRGGRPVHRLRLGSPPVTLGTP